MGHGLGSCVLMAALMRSVQPWARCRHRWPGHHPAERPPWQHIPVEGRLCGLTCGSPIGRHRPVLLLAKPLVCLPASEPASARAGYSTGQGSSLWAGQAGKAHCKAATCHHVQVRVNLQEPASGHMSSPHMVLWLYPGGHPGPLITHVTSVATVAVASTRVCHNPHTVLMHACVCGANACSLEPRTWMPG